MITQGTSGLKKLFPNDATGSLPITFCFGEPVNYEIEAAEMDTQYNNEETITRPGGGYDTGA